MLRGMSDFKIVGLGDQSVQESKERIRSAIRRRIKAMDGAWMDQTIPKLVLLLRPIHFNIFK